MIAHFIWSMAAIIKLELKPKGRILNVLNYYTGIPKSIIGGLFFGFILLNYTFTFLVKYFIKAAEKLASSIARAEYQHNLNKSNVLLKVNPSF